VKVWIVLKNGKVDEVFVNESAAISHLNKLNSQHVHAELIIKEVKR